MDFNIEVDRRNTYCTQWDYVEDRFGRGDLLPFTISDSDFSIPQEVKDALVERSYHPIYGYTRWNHPDFKSSVVDWYSSRFKTDVDGDWIVYSPSVIYSISQLIDLNSKK